MPLHNTKYLYIVKSEFTCQFSIAYLNHLSHNQTCLIGLSCT